ncbi:MAG: FxsA family protein [Gammaproteobacteria bacterium]|nr:FxsA family protein [Gammaproteobacteria bacterium]
MLRAWPLLFFVIPLVEIYFLVQVGEEIGAWMTVLAVVVTAVIGVSLLRLQGLKTLMRANQSMQSGQMPAQELFDGFMLAIVGVLLLTPGFVTDAIGFILLIPAIRKLLLHHLLNKMALRTASSSASAQFTSAHYTGGGQQPDETANTRSSRTIEGDFKRED